MEITSYSGSFIDWTRSLIKDKLSLFRRQQSRKKKTPNNSPPPKKKKNPPPKNKQTNKQKPVDLENRWFLHRVIFPISWTSYAPWGNRRSWLRVSTNPFHIRCPEKPDLDKGDCGLQVLLNRPGWLSGQITQKKKRRMRSRRKWRRRRRKRRTMRSNWTPHCIDWLYVIFYKINQPNKYFCAIQVQDSIPINGLNESESEQAS